LIGVYHSVNENPLSGSRNVEADGQDAD